MIRVHTADGEVHDFPDGGRYCTDEHNNLEIMAGNAPGGCFAEGFWTTVVVEK